jgi:hypothetical protein
VTTALRGEERDFLGFSIAVRGRRGPGWEVAVSGINSSSSLESLDRRYAALGLWIGRAGRLRAMIGGLEGRSRGLDGRVEVELDVVGTGGEDEATEEPLSPALESVDGSEYACAGSGSGSETTEPGPEWNLLGVDGNSGMLKRLTEDRIDCREVTDAALADMDRWSAAGELYVARAAAVGSVGEAASQAPDVGVARARGELWI